MKTSTDQPKLPSFWLRVAASGGVFFAGVPLGFVLRAVVNPDGFGLIAFALFPATFIACLAAWRVAALFVLGSRLVRGKPLDVPGESYIARTANGGSTGERVEFLPGGIIMIPTAAICAAFGGLLLAIGSSNYFWGAILGGVAGFGFGVMLKVLASLRLLETLES